MLARVLYLLDQRGDVEKLVASKANASSDGGGGSRLYGTVWCFDAKVQFSLIYIHDMLHCTAHIRKLCILYQGNLRHYVAMTMFECIECLLILHSLCRGLLELRLAIQAWADKGGQKVGPLSGLALPHVPVRILAGAAEAHIPRSAGVRAGFAAP